SWEQTLPTDLEGFYQFNLRSFDTVNNLSPEHTVWRGIIDHITPTVSISANHLGAGSAAYTEISFSAADQFLDLNNLSLPCGEESWQTTTYTADQTRTSRIEGTCRVAGHDLDPISVTACDVGGLCDSDSITLSAPSNLNGITIIEPQNNGVITSTTSPINIPVSGEAYDPDGIDEIAIYINGTLHERSTQVGSPTNVSWFVSDWQPIKSGSFTIQAEMTDTGNEVTSDTITVDVSFISCYTEYSGDGVADYSSSDASAIQLAIDAAPENGTVRVGGFCGNYFDLSEMLTISKTVTVEGGYDVNGDWSTSDPKANETILSGEASGRVIHITGNPTVTLRNLTVTDGYRLDGSGIYQENGHTTLDNLIVKENATINDGGGVLINGGTMIISGTEIISNTTTLDGGGIMVQNNSTILTVTRSTIAYNSSSGFGGGLYNLGATVTIDQSNIFGNESPISSGAGGGIYHTSLKPLIVQNSHIYNNRARSGGGLLLSNNNWVIQNSTISGNYANIAGGIKAVGSGTIRYSTIVSNTNGGGTEFASNPKIEGTIIAYNAGKECRNGTSINDQGYNFIDDDTCGLTAGTSFTSTASLLQPLADNGGYTLSYKPVIDSVLVNAVPNGTASCGTDVTTDQTGAARPKDGSCDIGAVEGDPNYAPIGLSDSYTATEEIALTVSAPGILANDNDVHNDPFTAVLESDVLSGTLTLAASGAFTYTGNLNHCGSDHFTYRADDGNSQSDPITVTLSISCTPDHPITVSDTFTVTEDSQNTLFNVLANDSDPDGDPLVLDQINTLSAGGFATFSGSQIRYTPAEDFFGTETFTYLAGDGTGLSTLGTVTVTITPVNDDPIAVSDSAETLKGQAVTIAVLDNDSDPENDELSLTGSTQGDFGSVAVENNKIIYTPQSNYVGTDGFGYFVSDGNGGSAVGFVEVEISQPNSRPEADHGGPYTVVEGQTITLDASGSYDPDQPANTLTYWWDLDGDGMAVDASGMTVEFSAADLEAPQSITINLEVYDNKRAIDFVITTVNVIKPPNVAPTADAGGPYTVVEGETVVLDASGSSDPNQTTNTLSFGWDLDQNGMPDSFGLSNITTTFSAENLEAPQTLQILLEVRDSSGAIGISSAVINVVERANTPPVADAGGPYSVTAGETIRLNGSGSRDSEQESATLEYSWDLDGDGVFDDSNSSRPTFSAASLQGPLMLEIGLKVTDEDGNSDIDRTQVSVSERPNSPPNAEAGGPYAVVAGKTVLLDASSSSDFEQRSERLIYTWDLDNDGEYDDAAGITTTFSALTLEGPISVTVGLLVADRLGGERCRYGSHNRKRSPKPAAKGPRRRAICGYCRGITHSRCLSHG
ncbi:MAG: Ig-like domain-containing protein, partial [Chloroflexota bacterium]